MNRRFMTRRFMRALAVSALVAAAPIPAGAVQPDEMLKDPQMESRAREISAELRCLVCQNQSIDDSDAPLARDLRLLVRERLRAGDNDSQVLQFLVDRYGDFILLRPPLGVKTYILWVAPLLIFLLGLVLARRLFRASRLPAASAPPAELTADEQRKLREVLGENSPHPQGGGT